MRLRVQACQLELSIASRVILGLQGLGLRAWGDPFKQ